MVDFCKKCGSLLIGKKGEEIKCPKCGFVNKLETEIKLTENIKEKEEKEILNDNVTDEVHPISNEVECPKCGNHEAYYWSQQTRAADEPETQFFKCTKCGHIWREYK